MHLSQQLQRIQESPTVALVDRVRRLKAEGKHVTALQTGDPDFDTPEPIVEAAYQALRDGMAHSLEVQVPFLDNDLVDFALRLPVRYKVRNLAPALWVDENDPGRRQRFQLRTNDGKAILRQAMARLIPPEITEQMKQGFSAPDASWFRGESIDYINQLLRNPKALIYEFLRPKYVSEVLDEHCSGQANRRLLIWSLLNFEWWLRTFKPGA